MTAVNQPLADPPRCVYCHRAIKEGEHGWQHLDDMYSCFDGTLNMASPELERQFWSDGQPVPDDEDIDTSGRQMDRYGSL